MRPDGTGLVSKTGNRTGIRRFFSKIGNGLGFLLTAPDRSGTHIGKVLTLGTKMLGLLMGTGKWSEFENKRGNDPNSEPKSG